MDKVQQLTALAKQHATGNIFIVGEALRHGALLRTKEIEQYRGTPQFPEMQAAVKSMWDSHSAVVQMYYLHLEMDFRDYYRTLPFWSKRKARRNQQQYMARRHTQLVDEADVLIDEVLKG